MKKLKIILFTIILLFLGASGASATGVLYYWDINLNGDFIWAGDTYLSPTTTTSGLDGDITNVSGFDAFSTSREDGSLYGGPESVGSLTVTFNPGVAGDYFVEGYFDLEIDEWLNGCDNESGAVVGTEPPGAYGAIDHPWGVDGDVAWLFAWDFSLTADQYAVVTFNLSDGQAPDGFYLSHTDDSTSETFYLTSSLDIEGGGAAPVPEPATMLLLGTGLAGVFGLGRKRFKK